MNDIIVYTISRINPHTGYRETIDYTGNIKNKPKGYKVIKKQWHTPYVDEHGLTGRI